MIFKKILSNLVKVLTWFVPCKNTRKKIRDAFVIETKGATFSPSIKHSKYGTIYLPTYNKSATQSNLEHNVFNAEGQPLKTFFLRDAVFSHSASSGGKYFMWDRYNFGLDVHFYTHNCMLEIMGEPKKRYGWLIEAESIVPADYQIFKRNKGLEKEFDLIFTHSEMILDSCDNARFYPACAGFWYGTPQGGGQLSSLAYQNKTKNISIVSSDKTMCKLHDLRIAFAKKCKQYGLADTFGNFDGGPMVPISESLANYRYSFAIENYISSYWFTEKVTNCFASMTIPIYLGASKIHEFFNPDGIIQIKPEDYDNIEQILNQCTEEEYLNRLEAVKDNYNRVMQFNALNDYMYEKYLKEDLAKM
jgi:hypothetical protein